MPRLFIALRPPAIVRDALIDLGDGVDDARWQDEDQLHLTLRLIGAVERPVAEDVAGVLGEIVAPGFDLALAGIGTFEHRGRVDTLWAGVAPNPALSHLQRKVESALQRAGLPPEPRRFHPHVTLARGRMGAGLDAFLVRHATLALPPFTVQAFGLWESDLGRGGALYDEVARYSLRTAP